MNVYTLVVSRPKFYLQIVASDAAEAQGIAKLHGMTVHETLAAKVLNPWSKASWSTVGQMRIMKEQPGLASILKQEAGV